MIGNLIRNENFQNDVKITQTKFFCFENIFFAYKPNMEMKSMCNLMEKGLGIFCMCDRSLFFSYKIVDDRVRSYAQNKKKTITTLIMNKNFIKPKRKCNNNNKLDDSNM